MNKTFIIFVFLFLITWKESSLDLWGQDIIESDLSNFWQSQNLSSYFKAGYRFYQSDPSVFDILVSTEIPYSFNLHVNQENKSNHFLSSSNSMFSTIDPNQDIIPSFPSSSLETKLKFLLMQKRYYLQNQYLIEQSWYGKNFHVFGGYGLIHRLNPVILISHQFPIAVGGYWEGWELQIQENFYWYPNPHQFVPLFSGFIAYHFFTHGSSLSGHIQQIFPHLIRLEVYQTSYQSFQLQNVFQFSLPSTVLSFSWKIFPIEIGFAIRYHYSNVIKTLLHTRYQPTFGFSQSLELGLMNRPSPYYQSHLQYLKQSRKTDLPATYD